MQQDIETCNFLVVGSGAAGLVAAVTAHSMGLRPVIVEKAAVWGGTTALSGGVLWVPGNHLMAEDGDADSPASARDYILGLMGDSATPRIAAKVERYLSAGPEMVAMLAGKGLKWARNAQHPDYYPLAQGARIGRTIEAELVDESALGPLLKTLRTSPVKVPPMKTEDFGACMRAKTGIRPFATAAGVVLRDMVNRLSGHPRASRGRALLVRLMIMVRNANIPLLLDTRLTEIRMDEGRVAGAVVQSAGKDQFIPASAGVMLAAGGFARNRDLRLKYHGDVDGSWTSAPPEDEGDALLAGQAIGAATEFMEHAWWQPSLLIGPGMAAITLSERALPGSIIVDETGARYMNEAASYMASGGQMRAHGGARNPHWLIYDSRFINRYIFRALGRGPIKQTMIANGYLKQGATLAELADDCGLNPDRLNDTISRFNHFAKTGVDQDFARGATDYDCYWADPAHQPNPSLGPISTPPFYAARIAPGDLGTNGGLMTNADSQVHDQQGQPIAGLYAAGNCSGSPFGGFYPGAGATIGAATTFGYAGACHAARLHNQG